MRVVVTGCSGFIGSHLCSSLSAMGYSVVGVDIQPPPVFRRLRVDRFVQLDLRSPDALKGFLQPSDALVALAADIGGMGHISVNEATILSNNARIDLNTWEAAAHAGVERIVYASSACVYPAHLQSEGRVGGLSESDAFPASPDGAYGFEKLFGEVALHHFSEQFGLSAASARFHNVYGPGCTFVGGREKAPAALCRKVSLAEENAAVDVWGDGKQARSFLFVDDCIEGLIALLFSEVQEPVNLGSEDVVSIGSLARMIIRVSGKPGLSLRAVDGPQGVRWRNSDSQLAKRLLDWEPATSLEDGLARTYAWIHEALRTDSPRY